MIVIVQGKLLHNSTRRHEHPLKSASICIYVRVSLNLSLYIHEPLLDMHTRFTYDYGILWARPEPTPNV